MKRSAPAVQVLVSHFEFWTRGVAVLVLASATSLVAWFVEAAIGSTPLTELALVSAGAVSFLALAVALLSFRCRAVSLRWDGRFWHAGPIDRVGSEPWSVHVAVRIDLGHWMLLEMCSDQTEFPPIHTWLPLQRQGMESKWHALRCALFAARNAAAIDMTSRASSA